MDPMEEFYSERPVDEVSNFGTPGRHATAPEPPATVRKSIDKSTGKGKGKEEDNCLLARGKAKVYPKKKGQEKDKDKGTGKDKELLRPKVKPVYPGRSCVFTEQAEKTIKEAVANGTPRSETIPL